MKLAPFYSSARAQYFDVNGDPLSNGRVSFYYPSSTTPKQIYSDADGTIPAPNPHILDAGGWVQQGGIRLGEGNYKVVLEASDGAGGYTEVWTMDDVPSSLPDGSGLSSTYVSIIDDLRGLTDGSIKIAYVLGYYAERDGGGGYFVWDKNSTLADDGGSVIEPSGSPAQGRWIRSFGDEVTAWQFGAMSTAPSVIDANLIRMMDFANSDKRKKVVIQSDDYPVSSVFSLSGDVLLELQEGARFIGSGQVTLDPTSLIIHGQKEVVDSSVDLFINPSNPIDAYADWWGNDWAVKSEGKYSARLKFNGLYALDPSASTFHEYWVFEEGAEINISALFYTTTIKGYEADKNWNNIWDGNINYLRVSDQGVFSINHFSNALVSSFGYSDFLNLVCDNGRRPRVLWGGYKTYNSVPAYSRPNNLFIDSEVLNGSLWSFNNSCWVGQIANDSFTTIFDINLLAYPIADNGVIYAQWFGATPEAPNNLQILEIANNWTQGLAPVEGNGATFLFEEDIYEFYDLGSNKTHYFRNMTLQYNGAVNVGTLSIRNNIRLENVKINSVSLNNTASIDIVIGNYQDIVNNIFYSANLISSEFNTDKGLSLYADIVSRDCTFESNVAPNFYAGIYENCVFSRNDNIVSSSTIFNFKQLNNFRVVLRINDCIFRSSIIVECIENVYIQNCDISFNLTGNLSGGLHLINSDPSNPLYPLSNIIIEKNHFSNFSGDLTTPSINANQKNGNINCVVKDNFFNGCAYRGTHRVMKKDYAFTQQDSDALFFPSDWIILPWAVYEDPNNGDRILPYTGNLMIMPTDPIVVTRDEWVMDSLYSLDIAGANYGDLTCSLRRIANNSGIFSAYVTLDVSANNSDSAITFV